MVAKTRNGDVDRHNRTALAYAEPRVLKGNDLELQSKATLYSWSQQFTSPITSYSRGCGMRGCGLHIPNLCLYRFGVLTLYYLSTKMIHLITSVQVAKGEHVDISC